MMACTSRGMSWPTGLPETVSRISMSGLPLASSRPPGKGRWLGRSRRKERIQGCSTPASFSASAIASSSATPTGHSGCSGGGGRPDAAPEEDAAPGLAADPRRLGLAVRSGEEVLSCTGLPGESSHSKEPRLELSHDCMVRTELSALPETVMPYRRPSTSSMNTLAVKLMGLRLEKESTTGNRCRPSPSMLPSGKLIAMGTLAESAGSLELTSRLSYPSLSTRNVAADVMPSGTGGNTTSVRSKRSLGRTPRAEISMTTYGLERSPSR
mmetsp:Transcript_14827/g.37489  ORF Transcript_14827/g.37489 Transcript_14827/m.37489 type:complete len:268 (-) Transcript_14827:3886-4689(-)